MRINLKIKFIIFIIGVFVNVIAASAQWNFSLTYDQEYNDNPFRLPEAQKSWVSTVDFGIERGFENINLGYYGSFSRFNSIAERNYYWHQFALWGGSDSTNWGVYGEQRLNSSNYNVYDYVNATAYFRKRFFLLGMMTNWSSSIYLNRYSQLSELNNWRFNSNIRIQKSFATRTTIISGLGFDYKDYLNSIQESLVDGEPMFNENNDFSNMYGNNGRGRGRGKGYLVEDSYTNFETASVSQLNYWIRLAQSLTQTTGLAVQYQTRQLITGLDRYVSGLSYSYSQESQFFDDPMSYESHSIGSELTQLLPFSSTLKLAFYFMAKNYSSQGIYVDAENFDESILRQDEYRTAWLSLKKNIGLNMKNGGQISLYFYFQWLDNQSNSYWYDFENRASSVGLEFEF